MRKLLVVRRSSKIKMKSKSILQLQYESEGRRIVKEYPIRDLEAVLIIGRGTYIESSVLSVLSTFNIPVTVVAGESVGVLINPIITIGPHYRSSQYNLEKKVALDIALDYIEAKIKGLINILKYHKGVVPEIPPLERSDNSEILERNIRSWEAQVSNKLWNCLIRLIKPKYLEVLKSEYGFAGRRPGHPDPFNKTLSVMYAVLYSLSTKSLLAAGLDPTYGFLHKTRYSTLLAFDYSEAFKPLAVEAAIMLINRKGLPKLGKDNELTREDVNEAIKQLYTYLTLRHKDTGKTPYQQIYLKAFCLAKYLIGKCEKSRITFVWDRAQYRMHRKF